MNYDNTVRYSDGTVIQFLYGDDGLDPSVVEGTSGGNCPLNLEQLIEDSKAEGTIKSKLDRICVNNTYQIFCIGKGEPRLRPSELVQYAESLTLVSLGAVEENEGNLKILNDIKNFLLAIARKHENELNRISSYCSNSACLFTKFETFSTEAHLQVPCYESQ